MVFSNVIVEVTISSRSFVFCQSCISRIASTLQSASLPDNNLTNDERPALKRLKTDKDIVILPADKGRVTVVMDRTDYHDKMNELVNDKQTSEELKRDPTPALQRKLNSKLLKLKKTDAIDIRRYYRLRCPVPQPPNRVPIYAQLCVFDAQKSQRMLTFSCQCVPGTHGNLFLL